MSTATINRTGGKTARLQLLAASVGTVVESFDWIIYAVLAPYFAGQMFAGSNPAAQLLSTYLVFAIGFIVRPLGAVIMGRLVDRRGRRFGLILSVWIISVGSVIIALTPTASVIGIWAAIIIVLTRMGQGISVSGEQAAAGTYLVETAPRNRVYLFGSIGSSATYIGQMLALGTVATLLSVLGQEALQNGGWRWGFSICGLLGIIASWIRRIAPESEVFEKEAKADPQPVLPVLKAHWRQSLAVFMMLIPATMGLYFVTSYMPVYLNSTGAATKEQVAVILPWLTMFLIAVIIVAGAVADRVGGLRMARASYIFLAVCTVPIILGMSSRTLPVVGGSIVYLIGLGAVTAPFAVLAPQLFPARVRAMGAALPSMLAVAVFGGTFPLVAQAMLTNNALGFLPYYIGAGALVGLIGSFVIRHKDLKDIQVAPKTESAVPTLP
ncbi:MFS transporter [Arthrobacter sp. MMS18-M83]|uniref:MFS transporter n=1 Tax=Arthrobacter sp. MMS18-M83 TaxID=2996261 RepID=UPI00227C02E0|nr:MFS transporter [Arthrobacter sp. MMS18-M83]WAH97630.1 MFS transporter [Arthrobacter sp. MMS18-M83]